MNLKYYVRGVGVGMVTATLILAVAYHIRPDSQLPPANTQSSRDIMANLRSTEADSQSNEASRSGQESSKGGESQESSQNPVEPDTPPAPTLPPESTEPEGQGSVITVEFQQIRTSEEAAMILENAGLVDNWTEFNNFLIRNGYASRIHNGTYTIEAGSSYEAIADIITRR